MTTETKTNDINKNPHVITALATGATSILPKNRERLLPRDPQVLKTKLDEIIANSFQGHEARYNRDLQLSEEGLVVS